MTCLPEIPVTSSNSDVPTKLKVLTGCVQVERRKKHLNVRRVGVFWGRRHGNLIDSPAYQDDFPVENDVNAFIRLLRDEFSPWVAVQKNLLLGNKFCFESVHDAAANAVKHRFYLFVRGSQGIVCIRNLEVARVVF